MGNEDRACDCLYLVYIIVLSREILRHARQIDDHTVMGRLE